MSRNSNIIDVSHCIKRRNVLTTFAVLLPAILLITLMPILIPFAVFEFLQERIFGRVIFLFPFVVFGLIALAVQLWLRRSRFLPMDWIFYAFARLDLITGASGAADAILRFQRHQFRTFRIPRILRPRSYPKSFALLVLTIAVWALIIWGIGQLEITREIASFDSLIRSVSRTPFGEYIFGALLLIPMGLAYLTLVYLRPDARSAFGVKGERITVFLRPFGFDRLQIASSTFGFFGQRKSEGEDFEDVLSRTFNKGTFFVGIGDPKEKIPSLGALKSYFSDNEWQDQILSWMDRADLVLLTLGSEQTLWEYDQLAQKGLLERTIFLIPHEYQAEYTPGKVALSRQVWRLTLRTLNGTEWSEELKECAGPDDTPPLAVRLAPGGKIYAVTSDEATQWHYKLALMYLAADVLAPTDSTPAATPKPNGRH